MKKLMIVSSDLLGETLKVILANHFDGVVLVDREQALETFLTEEPTHVLISDTVRSPKDVQLVKDLQGANVNSRIVRYGFDSKTDIQLPFDRISELIDKLMGEHKD